MKNETTIPHSECLPSSHCVHNPAPVPREVVDYTEKQALGELDKNEFFELENMPFNYGEHMILSAFQGSISYGTNTPESDVDIRGIIIPPEEYFLGMRKFEQAENQKKDICYYSLKKFFQLAYKCGPHAIELLYIDPRHILSVTPMGQEVLDNREMFLSRAIGYSFGGYAWQQLKQLVIKKQNHTGRVNLIDKYGYDTKMAAHAIRLYRSGAEALETGVLNVFRPDAAELLEIRNGKYSLEEFAKFEDYQDFNTKKKRSRLVGGMAFNELARFDEAFRNTKLPKLADYDKVNGLLVSLLKKHFGWN